MENIGNTQITLFLTLDEINGVLTSLGNMPYGHVHNLVEKIRDQAVPQIPTPTIAEELKTDA
jgi:hypothetical protein